MNSKKYVAFVLVVVVLASLATAYYMSITEQNSNEGSKQTNRINWSAKNTGTPTQGRGNRMSYLMLNNCLHPALHLTRYICHFR